MAERYFLYPTPDSISLVVWDIGRQQTLGKLEGHDGLVEVVAARGSQAVSYQDSGPVRARVWNLETMQCTATLPGGLVESSILAACCIEGKMLLGGEDGIVKVWDIAASAPVALVDLEGHTSAVFSVKAATAGSLVLSGSRDKTMRLWELRTSGRCVRTMEGHASWVWTVDIDGPGHTAVSGSIDSTVKLWDLGSGRCMQTYELDEVVNDLVMHESGRSFLSYERKNDIVKAWDVGSTRAIMRADMASSGMPNSSGSRLFASKDLSVVAFWSIGARQLRLSLWR